MRLPAKKKKAINNSLTDILLKIMQVKIQEYLNDNTSKFNDNHFVKKIKLKSHREGKIREIEKKD